MTTQIQRRPGGRSARVRADVLDAALQTLVEDGWGGCTIEAVAERAGVHKTTVYRRWGDREALLLDALLARSAQQVEIPDTGDPTEDLRRFLRAVRDNVCSPVGEALVRVAASEASGAPEVRRMVEQFWTERFALASTIVDRDLIELAVAPLYFRLLVTGEPLDDAFLDGVVALVTRR